MRDITEILKAVDKAVPIKTEIELIHKGELKDLQERFMSDIGAPKKIVTVIPNHGEDANKSLSSIFKSVVDGIVNFGGDYTSKTKQGSIERKVQDIGWIVYFAQITNLESELKNIYNFFGVKSIEIDKAFYDAYFSNLDTMNPDVIRNVLFTASDIVKEISDLENQIKNDIFESIGGSVYNKDTNPDGIKQSEFLSLVACKANDDVEKQREKQIARQEEIVEHADAFVDILRKIQ